MPSLAITSKSQVAFKPDVLIFADGIMTHEGAWLGGQTFVSFDKQAVSLRNRQAHAARLPA